MLRRLVVQVLVGLAVLLGLAAGGVGAQESPMARIELELATSSNHELVVYPITESGLRGPELVRETFRSSSDEARWEVDVEPGCYAVSIAVSSGGLGGWEDPVSNQPTFCLDPGEIGFFETGRRLPGSSGRNVHNGEVVDPAGNRLDGAVIDFFEAPEGLTPSEVRMLDHRAADHRGPFVSSQISGQFNWVYATIISGCWVQTLTAPDGYSWAGGRQFVNRSTCSSNYAVMVAYPNDEPVPEHGSIELDIPTDMLGRRMTAAVGTAVGETLPAGIDWFRITDQTRPHQSRSDVPPGCYSVDFARSDGRSIWSTSGRARQAVPVCVDGGETAVVSPRGEVRIVDYDETQPFLTGGFVDEAGAPVSGVQVDLFHPQPGLSDEELRNVDHSTADYRGTWYQTALADADGRFAIPVYERCFVATLIAPEGMQFDSGRFRQMTRCQGDAVDPIVVRSDDPVEGLFSGKILTESGAGVEGIAIDVFKPASGVTDDELRNADHVAIDYRAEYTRTVTTDADGQFAFEAEPGCRVLTYIGDERISFLTGRYFRDTLCPGEPSVLVVPDGITEEPGVIDGVVTGGGQIFVDLFLATGDGSRGEWLGDTATVDGRYSFEVPAGCYITVLLAEEPNFFAATGTRWQQMAGCVESEGTLTNPVGELRS